MNRRKYSTKLVALTLLLSVFSCNKDTELIVNASPYGPPNDMRKIIPFDLGYSWTYRVIACVDFGPPFCDTGITSRTIVGRTNFDSHTAYYVYGLIDETIGYYLEYADSSSYVRFLSAFPPESPRRILQAPLRKGHKWKYSVIDTIALRPDTLEIVNADSTVNIESKTYHHAIVVQGHSGLLTLEFIIVPNIGIVREYRGHGFGSYSVDLVRKNF